MKSSILFAFLSMVSVVCSQSPPPPERSAQSAKQAPAKIRFKGKIGAPTTTTVTATRSGDQGAIKLVAIAPGHEGITGKARPRLWWYQSEATGPRELEFVLSRMDGTPKVLFRRPINPSMAKGFNVLDFNNRGFNKEGVSFENGAIYQWTIRLVSEKTAPQVYCRMKAEIKEPVAETPDITALAESGNWYELFDAVASRAQDPDAEEMIGLRGDLLEQVGLSAAVE